MRQSLSHSLSLLRDDPDQNALRRDAKIDSTQALASQTAFDGFPSLFEQDF